MALLSATRSVLPRDNCENGSRFTLELICSLVFVTSHNARNLHGRKSWIRLGALRRMQLNKCSKSIFNLRRAD